MKLHHLRTLRQIGGTAKKVRLSPDGRYIASSTGAGSDRESTAPQVCVWTVESGELVCALTAHRSAVRGLAFDMQGALLATCGDDIWYRDSIDSPGGDRILERSEASIWRVDSGQRVAVLECHQRASMGDVGFGPGGDFLVTGTESYLGGPHLSYCHAEVGFWRIADANRLQVHHADTYSTRSVRCVRTSRDGAFIVTLTSDSDRGGELQTWTARKGFFSNEVTLRLRRKLPLHFDPLPENSLEMS